MKYIFANYIVLVLAIIFEGSTWLVAFREFSRSKGRRGYLEMVRRAKNPSVFVVLFEDSAALLGLLVAFLGILLGQLTGKAYYDGGGGCDILKLISFKASDYGKLTTPSALSCIWFAKPISREWCGAFAG